MRIGFLVVLAVCTVLAVAGCSAEGEISLGGSNEIDREKAEEEISGGLEAEHGDPPKSLTCPEGVEIVEGETFICEGEDPVGAPFEIEVTMTDDEGGVRYPTSVTYTGEPAGSAS